MTTPRSDAAPTRRELLRATAATSLSAPLAFSAPFAWPTSSRTSPHVRGRWLPGGDDACLVVIELAGGNDALNTVIPLDDARYSAARPQLEDVRRRALRLGDGFGLHESLPELHRLVQDGRCGIVQGVGYPNPDRSHFRSRDIWYTADPSFVRRSAATTGWLGRAADLLADRGAAVPGLSVGSVDVPLCFQGRRVVVPALERIEDYALVVDPSGGKSEVRRDELAALLDRVREAPPTGSGPADLETFLGDVAASARGSADRLATSLAGYRPAAAYPSTAFGRALQLLARVIVSGFGTRLFHVELGGFDTHARQAPAHAGLLRQLSRAVGALMDDLAAQGADDRVTVFVHSEFGRRVAENRSHGTDHGAAGVVFALGAGVEPGVHGSSPDLDDLDDGDVRMTTDFRSIYAELLTRIGVPPATVLRDDGVPPGPGLVTPRGR